jgi:GDP-4-dehydro-6-deoxy-D-mannose reductase
MTANLLEAVRREAPAAVVVAIASSEIYGPPERLPVDEDAPLKPQNPYAVSKAACDLLAARYAEMFGLHLVRMRPFNHAGPGQADEYVLGTLTRQVAAAEAAGASEVELRTGNPDPTRDFTDVRDVVRAYVAASSLEPGVYNVASGRAVSVRELIELVRAATPLPVRHEIDPARVRAVDVPEVRGSAERLREATGWRPEIPLERTVADALDAWRQALARS